MRSVAQNSVNVSRSSNANHQQQTGNTDDVISTTGRDNEDGERELIPDVKVDTIVSSSTTSTFDEPMNDDTAPTTKNYIGVMIVINIEIMGSNCLVDLRLRRKSHGLWRTTRTYQWRYSWYKLDGRGVTEVCATDRIRIWRYASNWCWSYDEGSSGSNELIV